MTDHNIGEPSAVPTVDRQYSTDSYADFVEDETNADFYGHYVHPSIIGALSQSKRRKLDAASSVLDVGCGNGVLGRALRGVNPRLNVWGVDQSAAMLERARGHHRDSRHSDENASGSKYITEFVQANFVEDDIPDELFGRLFDHVVSSFVLCHLSSRDDLAKFFRRAYNFLMPGGTSAHIVPPTEEHVKEGHAEGRAYVAQISDDCLVYDHHWKKETYMDIMAEVGFVDVRVENCRVHNGDGLDSAWVA